MPMSVALWLQDFNACERICRQEYQAVAMSNISFGLSVACLKKRFSGSNVTDTTKMC